MTYQVLSLKWRPDDFESVVGQNHITITLSNAIKLNRIAHAFTFSGPRGVGKTTTARILAKTLNNIENIDDSFDIIEMDAASNRGIDEIRNLNESVNYAPSHGKYKIYIIDEAHMLTKEAFNALLKTLEEPPEYVVFILCTTELFKMPTTILSRTQRFDFKRIENKNIVNHLIKILKSEKILFETECLESIAEKSEGSMRDALSILDQMICLCDNNLTFELVKNVLGIVDDQKFYNLLKLISSKDSALIIDTLNQILSEGISVQDFIKGFNKFVRNVIVDLSLRKKEKKSNLNKYDIELSELDLLRVISLTLKFQGSMKYYQQLRVELDTLMLKLAYLDKTIDIEKFVSSKDNNSINQQMEEKSSLKNIQSENNDIFKNKTLEKNNDEEYQSKDDSPTLKKKELNRKTEDSKEENVEPKNCSLLSLEDFEKRWKEFMELLENKNIKTANFLRSSDLVEYKNNILSIRINKVSRFIYKVLLNDLDIIKETMFELFSEKIDVKLIEGKLEEREEKNKLSDKNKKEHPLFMDVLNKFEGEVIR